MRRNKIDVRNPIKATPNGLNLILRPYKMTCVQRLLKGASISLWALIDFARLPLDAVNRFRDELIEGLELVGVVRKQVQDKGIEHCIGFI
jgi:hypothetical protein